MPAPKGHQFWKARTKHGRDKLFASADLLWEACVEYFEWVEANPLYEAKAFAYEGDVKIEELPKMRAMTLGGLCVFLDIDVTTWRAWRKVEDFSTIVSRVDEIVRDQKFSGAAAGLLNANIIARDLGLAEKQEVSGPEGAPLQTEAKVTLALDPDFIKDALRELNERF